MLDDGNPFLRWKKEKALDDKNMNVQASWVQTRRLLGE